MSEARRAANLPASLETAIEADRARDADQADRIVVVDAMEGAWRVQAAHMEPLRFRSAAEAERAGHRVARTLARLGFNARVETYDAAGDLGGTARYQGETPGSRPPARRHLDS